MFKNVQTVKASLNKCEKKTTNKATEKALNF